MPDSVSNVDAGAAAELTVVLQALAEPQRLALLRLLADDDWHACGSTSWAAALHKATVSHHLRVLEEAGIIEDRRSGRQKLVRLRRASVDERFPGLLSGVLGNL